MHSIRSPAGVHDGPASRWWSVVSAIALHAAALLVLLLVAESPARSGGRVVAVNLVSAAPGGSTGAANPTSPASRRLDALARELAPSEAHRADPASASTEPLGQLLGRQPSAGPVLDLPPGRSGSAEDGPGDFNPLEQASLRAPPRAAAPDLGAQARPCWPGVSRAPVVLEVTLDARGRVLGAPRLLRADPDRMTTAERLALDAVTACSPYRVPGARGIQIYEVRF
jgi:hypothetical protein